MMQVNRMLVGVVMAGLIAIFALTRLLNTSQSPDITLPPKAKLDAATPNTPNHAANPQLHTTPHIAEHRNTTSTQIQRITEDTIDTLPAAKITTYNDLMTLLQGQPIDLDSVVDFINQSPDGFEYVVAQLSTSNNAHYKHMLIKILDNSQNPKRSELAAELAYSDNTTEREAAYRWLSLAPNIDNPKIYNVLIDAIYQESDPQLLSNMLSTLSIPDANTDPVAFEYALSRVYDLAKYDDPTVASNAITKAAEISQSQPTLDMLLYHAQSNDKTRQLAAIEGLKNFETPKRVPVLAIFSAFL